MVEIVVPVAAMWMLVACVVQLRRLITDALLYRTIVRVAATDADSARLLIGKVEPRPRHVGAPGGWACIVASIAVGALGASSEGNERAQMFQVAAVLAVIGAGMLAFWWWSERAARRAVAES
ncbi:hypothetical protein KZ813_17140 [Sphingomonas sp. RHCKR7]|uniref:hypothetical protein n=1 Tax=Sphingomonas folli TaxID=2862497 RepID=UPI001CA4869A|nr:hypothetical protein [Sphingomonas folli]MBW6528570.1 hypothetical protein [Sphingomonas folli]